MAGRVLRNSRGQFNGSTRGFGKGAKKPRNGQYAGLGGKGVKPAGRVAAAKRTVRTKKLAVKTDPRVQAVTQKKVGVQVGKVVRGRGANKKVTYHQRNVTVGDIGGRVASGAKAVGGFQAHHAANRTLAKAMTGQAFKRPGAGYNAAVFAAGYKGRSVAQMDTAIRSKKTIKINQTAYKTIKRKQLARNVVVAGAVAGGVAYAKRNHKIESVILNAAFTAAVKRKQSKMGAASTIGIAKKAAKVSKGYAKMNKGVHIITSL